MSVALPGSGSKLLRVRYRTDGAVVGLGFSIDDIAITGSAVDGAETGNEGWTYTRFERIDGVFKTLNPSVYIAEYKTHTGYDASLATAYNFGFLDSKPDWVETHPYAEGLLVNYWNGTYEDNNVGEHPGEGQLLPVDAHPTWFHASDGHLLRNRVLSFDSAFGLKPVPSITVHKNSQPTTIPAQAANPLFDDTVSYWSANDGHVGADGLHVGRYQPGWYSVRTPSSGTQIRVVDQSAGKMIVHVRPGRWRPRPSRLDERGGLSAARLVLLAGRRMDAHCRPTLRPACGRGRRGSGRGRARTRPACRGRNRRGVAERDRALRVVVGGNPRRHWPARFARSLSSAIEWPTCHSVKPRMWLSRAWKAS